MVDEEPGPGEAAPTEAENDRITRRYGSLISMRPLPLPFKRGGADDRPRRFWRRAGLWRRRLVHMWRYGVYHPDEDLLGVIDAAADSLTTQIMAAEAVLGGSRLERLRDVKEELRRELRDEVPELAVLLGIEAKINALYPPAIQRRRAWMIRDRFRRVAPGQAAEYWAAERIEAHLEEAQGDRIRQADDAVARAGARQSAAAAAAEAAETALPAAQGAYDAARGQLQGTDDEVAAKLDRLKALRASAAGEGEPAERDALEQEVGPLLDARDARDAATAVRDAAAAERDAAERAAEGARLERDRTLARCELERTEARLRGAQRAALDAQAGAGAAESQRQVEAARSEAAAARERLDRAAAAVQAHAGAGAAPPEGGGAPPDDPPPDPPPPADGAADAAIPLDADAQTLLGYVHSSYLMGIAREKAVRDLMRWLMMRFWTANLFLVGGLLLLWALVEILSSDLESLAGIVIGLFFIAAVGRVGATMSVVQRLQQAVASNVLSRDPILELTRLRTGKHGINLALFSGGVFALLMYSFIASGIPTIVGLDDGIAPALARIQQGEEQEARVRARADVLNAAAERVTDAQAAVDEAERDRDAPAPEQPPAAEANPQADSSRAALDARVDAARAELERATTALAEARTLHDAARNQGGQSESASAPTSDKRTDSLTPQQEAARRWQEWREARHQRNLEIIASDTQRHQQAASRTGVFQRLRDLLFGPPTDEPRQAEGAASQCKATDECDPFLQLSQALGLAERIDFFKLLIWAFLAGFAERLVPDVLDTIANRARRRRRQEEQEEDDPPAAAPAATPATPAAPAG